MTVNTALTTEERRANCSDLKSAGVGALQIPKALEWGSLWEEIQCTLISASSRSCS